MDKACPFGPRLYRGQFKINLGSCLFTIARSHPACPSGYWLYPVDAYLLLGALRRYMSGYSTTRELDNAVRQVQHPGFKNLTCRRVSQRNLDPNLPGDLSSLCQLPNHSRTIFKNLHGKHVMSGFKVRAETKEEAK